MLQWGHVFSDVETRENRFFHVLQCEASMGPRLFRRGNIWQNSRNSLRNICASMGPRLFRRGNARHSTSTQRGLPDCFNGATSFQTWKQKVAAKLEERAEKLQWGHVFSDVETVCLS